MNAVNLYIGYNAEDFKKYRSTITEKGFLKTRLSFEDLELFLARAKKHRKNIQDFYNHYRTHFADNSLQLCELRCVTAWAMWSLDENIRLNIFSTDFLKDFTVEKWVLDECFTANEFWENNDGKRMWQMSLDNLEVMCDYAVKNGHHASFEQYKYFDFSTNTNLPAVKENEKEETVKRKIGFY
jgi:hypothetical protein